MQLGAVKYLIKHQIGIWSIGMWTMRIIQQGADIRSIAVSRIQIQMQR